MIRGKASTRFAPMMDGVLNGTMSPEPARDDAGSVGSPNPIVIGEVLSNSAVSGSGHVNLAAAIRQLVGQVSHSEADRTFAAVLGEMADTVHEGLILCDKTGRITYVNRRISRILGGLRPDELLHQSLDDHLPALLPPIAVAHTRGEHQCRFEVSRWDGTGAERLLQVYAALVHGADGEFEGFYAVVDDITGRRQADEDLSRSEHESSELSAKLLAVQEEERRRVARDLQDGIGQAMGELKFGLEAFAELVDLGDPHAAKGLGRLLISRFQGAVEQVRRISMNLYPSTLDDLGLLATVGWLMREFTHQHRELDVQTSIDLCEEEIPAAAKTAIYRTLQEGLNNVVMHAGARHVVVALGADDSAVQLTIKDDGVGFDPALLDSAMGQTRLGLPIMRERAEASCGNFQLETGPGAGTCIRVSWPRACPLGS